MAADSKIDLKEWGEKLNDFELSDINEIDITEL